MKGMSSLQIILHQSPEKKLVLLCFFGTLAQLSIPPLYFYCFSLFSLWAWQGCKIGTFTYLQASPSDIWLGSLLRWALKCWPLSYSFLFSAIFGWVEGRINLGKLNERKELSIVSECHFLNQHSSIFLLIIFLKIHRTSSIGILSMAEN